MQKLPRRMRGARMGEQRTARRGRTCRMLCPVPIVDARVRGKVQVVSSLIQKKKGREGEWSKNKKNCLTDREA